MQLQFWSCSELISRWSLWGSVVAFLVAPYCAIPRDYLSDTPRSLRAMGFLVSQHGLGCDTPAPFSERFPLGEHSRSGGAIPPPQKGYLSDTCAIPYENKANGCDTPLCDTISKGYCAIWGGISRWAAKPTIRCNIDALWHKHRTYNKHLNNHTSLTENALFPWDLEGTTLDFRTILILRELFV